MNHTADVSPTACRAKNLGFKCTSQWDQLWREGIDSHGDFNPACSNTTAHITPLPTIAPFNGSCPSWQAIVDSVTQGKPGFKEIAIKNGSVSLLYKLEAGKLEAKMLYRGIAGWMAIGPENPGGFHNGALTRTHSHTHAPHIAHSTECNTRDVSVCTSALVRRHEYLCTGMNGANVVMALFGVEDAPLKNDNFEVFFWAMQHSRHNVQHSPTQHVMHQMWHAR